MDYLDPITPIQEDMCFHLIQMGWNLIRLNNLRNGLYNIEIKNVLKNSYNYEHVHLKKHGEIKKILNDLQNKNEVLGMVFSRDRSERASCRERV